jgi:hypothetical protein
MSHPIFRTSQDFTSLHFDVAGICFVAERHAGIDGQAPQGLHAPQSLHEEREPGTLLPFLSLVLGIAVSADAGRAS